VTAMRVFVLLGLCLFMACQDKSVLGTPRRDSGQTDADTASGFVSASGGANETDSGEQAPHPGDPPPTVENVSCVAIQAASTDWELCFEGPEHCEAIYYDGAGCRAVCAAADLPCTGVYENRDGTCAPDLTRDSLPCDSGHQSDYCICGGSGTSAVDDPGTGATESLLAERTGFGRHAQGGDPGRVYTVTSLADAGPGSLRAALESSEAWWISFAVDGRIEWDDEVRVASNKTVDGRGRAVTVDGTWRLDRVHDVIISDLTLTRSSRAGEEECEQDGDVVIIRGRGGPSPSDFDAHDIWLNHLDFQRGGDGLLDIRGGTHITVSWSHFTDHKKVSLAWQDEDGEPTAGMELTWHHNHFDHTTVRNPRMHYGRVHFVNNFVDEWWQSGAASYDGAEFFSEANIYLAADDCYGIPEVLPCVDENPCAVNNNWFVDRSLALVSSGEAAAGLVSTTADLLLNGAEIEVNRPLEVFDPRESYSFTAETATESLAAIIASESGPRTDWSE
jgi:pectate lyase